jgi:hypothetical protein
MEPVRPFFIVSVDFCGEGDAPSAATLIDSAGNLSGTAAGGGLAHGGTIFELTH